MATDDLRERLERFRIEMHGGRATLVARSSGGDAERWLRSCPRIPPPPGRGSSRELQPSAPLRPRGTVDGGPRLTPDDFAFRTMGR